MERLLSEHGMKIFAGVTHSAKCGASEFDEDIVPRNPCIDSSNNTYNCLRSLNQLEDTVYCEFRDNDAFVEFYNISQDPFEMVNSVGSLSKSVQKVLHEKLAALQSCSGSSCYKDIPIFDS